jgi:hypothetical protein
MSGEKPVAVTLESIAGQIDELKSQLRVEIEAVRSDVKLVYEAVVAQNQRHKRNDVDHGRFRKRLADHDVRILALEKKRS